MLKRPWSVARLMTTVAILALSFTALLALRTPSMTEDLGVGVLALVLALILTAAADRAVFGRDRRAFWLGFTAAGWLCAAAALTHYPGTRDFLLYHGPLLARAREDFRRQHMVDARARALGLDPVTPRVSEWYLLGSLLTEVGFGLTLGALAASAGGLLTASVAIISRQADRRLHPPRPVATPGNSV